MDTKLAKNQSTNSFIGELLAKENAINSSIMNFRVRERSQRKKMSQVGNGANLSMLSIMDREYNYPLYASSVSVQYLYSENKRSMRDQEVNKTMAEDFVHKMNHDRNERQKRKIKKKMRAKELAEKERQQLDEQKQQLKHEKV